ncbi:hypothetical protein LguiB_001483 [Lonicera macranthoides]
MSMNIISIFILFFSFPLTFLSAQTLTAFPVPSGGPESIIFNPAGGFFTGVNDGRIVKYRGSKAGWVDFAYASPTRTVKRCEGTTDPALGNICGRTLGLGMNYNTRELYLVDAYHGLCVVGPEGGQAKQLLSSAAGLPFKWLDGIDVDQTTGNVYFTEVSTVYNLSQVKQHLASGDSTGRLIEYNVKTKKERVLLTRLKGAGGAGVAIDGSFVLLTEFTGNRITKYWLKGPKANTAELLMNISGPANVKRTQNGEFWIALNVPGKINIPTGIRMDGNGKILEKISFGAPYNNSFINEVHEHHGKLYISSIYVDFYAVYKYSRPLDKLFLFGLS